MSNDIKSLNDMFKEIYVDSITELLPSIAVWVADTKTARKLYKNEIQDERDGEIRIADKKTMLTNFGFKGGI